MINISKSNVEVVLGEKDIVIRGISNQIIFESADETQTVLITFKTEENMRVVVDVINYLHFINYFKHSSKIDEKYINSLRENGGIENVRESSSS